MTDPCASRVLIAKHIGCSTTAVECPSCKAAKGDWCDGIRVEILPARVEPVVIYAGGHITGRTVEIRYDARPIPDVETWPRHTGEV